MKLLILSTLVAFASAGCSTPSSTPFTNTDASILQSIAYISQFKLACDSPSANYFAVDDNGVVYQLGSVGKDEWVVSFLMEPPVATKGDHVLKIFNEDGISALRKKQAPVPLTTVTINHPGAYNGPWLNSEHLAAILGVVVGYLAISSKGRLLA